MNCEHNNLKFKEGGLMLVCAEPDCEATWIAVAYADNRENVTLDFGREADGTREKPDREYFPTYH